MEKVVALSTTEAELIALVLCVQEMMFIKKVLESMELKLELPMIVECDNKGTVDLVNGHQSAGGTKHIDVRLLFVRELKEEGIIKVRWIPTGLNEADILTKNTGQDTYLRHTNTFMAETSKE